MITPIAVSILYFTFFIALGLLALFTLLAFSGAFLAFVRYDIR